MHPWRSLTVPDISEPYREVPGEGFITARICAACTTTTTKWVNMCIEMMLLHPIEKQVFLNYLNDVVSMAKDCFLNVLQNPKP